MEEKTRKAVEDALYDDLDIPKALALLHEAGSWEAWKRFDPVLGLRLEEKKPDLQIDVHDLIKVRDEARVKGDFERADKIRKELAERGIILEDTSSGTRIIRQ